MNKHLCELFKNNPSGYDLIVIVDMKTNEVFYPKIIK